MKRAVVICPFVLGKSFLSSQADMGMSFCEGKKRRKKMELAAITLYKTLVMTMLALLGAFCYKRGIITEEINKNLSDFVLRLLTPVLLFHCFQMEFSQELLQGILVAFVLAGVSFGVIWAISKITVRGQEKDYACVEHIAIMYSNCGFIGIPMVQGIFGSEGVL